MFKFMKVLDSRLWRWQICWPCSFCTVNPDSSHSYLLSSDDVAFGMIADMDSLVGLNTGLLQRLMKHVRCGLCCPYYSGGQGKMKMRSQWCALNVGVAIGERAKAVNSS